MKKLAFKRAAWHEITISNLHLAVFGTFYFLSAVLVNILYATDFGKMWPIRFIPDFMWSNFSYTFGLGYWILILCPFIALPLVAIPTARAIRPVACWSLSIFAEFPKIHYAILCVLLYAYVTYVFVHTDAAHMLFAGRDAMDAVNERFALQNAIGFQTRVVILSLLFFLAIYACVKAIRHKDIFWKSAAVVEVVAMFACLSLLNMKWPIILFIITLGFAVFVVSRRYVIIKTMAIMLFGVATYFVISVIVLQAVPATQAVAIPPSVQTPSVTTTAQPVPQDAVPAAQSPEILPAAPSSEIPHVDTAAASPSHQVSSRNAYTVRPGDYPYGERSYISRIAYAVEEHAGKLTVVALNRMGIALPFYYDIFTMKGPICGGFFDWVLHTSNLKCRPSIYVYSEMFHDEFSGKGTAPAAFHIYEYARGGWTGVVTSLLIAGIILGAFMSLRKPAEKSDILATIFVMGAPVSYLLTQLPIEGAIIYDNGVVWWGLLVVMNSFVALVFRKQRPLEQSPVSLEPH